MAEFDILGDTLGDIDFGATGTKEILQNVKTIITTPKYTVPLFRDFGIEGDPTDRPMPVAQAKHIANIIRAVQQYEPRAKVLQVTYVNDPAAAQDGKLIPKVRVSIVEYT